MEIDIPENSIILLLHKLSERIFSEEYNVVSDKNKRVHFTQKTSRRLRDVVFQNLLWRRIENEKEIFNVKETLCVLGFKMKANRLENKANQLEKLISCLDLSLQYSSPYSGKLDKLCEVEAVVKILLALTDGRKTLTQDPCEVWRKDRAKPTIFDNTFEGEQTSIDYDYYTSEIFKAPPTFGIPRRGGFENSEDSLQSNIFSREPGSHGLTAWFGTKTNDLFSERTRSSLYSSLVQSKASDMDVKLQLPDLPCHNFWEKPLYTTLTFEDEGLKDASEKLSTLSEDSGVHDLDIWDEALKLKPSKFYTWEGRQKMISKTCKPFLIEAGPDVIDCFYSMRLAEASFLINVQPLPFVFYDMKELIRDCLMLLIGVPSQTFQLEKSTGSFHVSAIVRLSGCSPDSIQASLMQLAEMGTNYYRLNKFTTYQRPSKLIRSTILRAFTTGLGTYLQKYRQSVITVHTSSVQSVFGLIAKFKNQAYQLRFLSDVCMCSQGFATEFGKPKPKFPVGVKLLSYLYELCLQNINATVANLLLFLLRVSCTPYLKFIQQWVFKGKCIDLCKEFMISENDVFLAYRDKHYWMNGYVMSGEDKMEGVPIFMRDLAKDMFICGKSINLLKLCCPEHYICSNEVDVPVMAVVYSISSLRQVSHSSRLYAEKMKALQEHAEQERIRKKNEERLKLEQILASERKQAKKALTEIRELIMKAKQALAAKKKEELDFLKQQMENAINRKALERKEIDEEDAHVLRSSLDYEVATARNADDMVEEARQELIHYYEELTREAEKREQHAVWLAKRLALKDKRETFLKKEEDELHERKTSLVGKFERDLPQTDEKLRTVNEMSTFGNESFNSNDSAPQDFIYNAGDAVGSQSSRTYPRVSQSMQSTAQELMYQQDMVPDTGSQLVTTRNITISSTLQDPTHSSFRDSVITVPPSSTSLDGETMIEGTDSTVQHNIHHSEEMPLGMSTDRTIITPAAGSTVQQLLYHSAEGQTTPHRSSRGVEKIASRASDSTAQVLLYHSEEQNPPKHRSTRGVGSAMQSTIETHLYDYVDAGSLPKRSFEPSGIMKEIVYEHHQHHQSTSTRGMEQPSVIKDILYPDTKQAVTAPNKMVATRGRAPSSTIQNIMYHSSSLDEEPTKKPERRPLTQEDVWLDLQFESLPDNFDVMNKEPCGDFFSRVVQHREGVYHTTEQDESLLNLDCEKDACDILCLPVILQQCVMEPLITQIKVVNSAVVRHFMDDLKLVEHFETLKKFLLMEDGEFSYALTQQLFEKILSGVTPQQLCCISTLNSIMAQSIQSSVYACHSENTRSLSFVLNSIPEIFKRNDVKVLNFIELRYKIHWPVNIIITENCINKYNRIFSFMLQVRRTAWILQDIRYSLKRLDKCAHNSPQLRKIHLFRHEMSHFVNDVQGYISNQILHVSWQEFLTSLEHNVQNFDELHDCHAEYLNKCLFRALLNKKAAPVLNIITGLFGKVLQFHTQLVSSSWSVDPSSGDAVHPGFSLLFSTYTSFKESTCFLLTVIAKLVNRGYQPHLQELLLRLNFNSYYGKNTSNQNTVYNLEI